MLIVTESSNRHTITKKFVTAVSNDTKRNMSVGIKNESDDGKVVTERDKCIKSL